MFKLFNHFINSTDKFAVRDFTVFYLLGITGIRVGELVALNYNDIDLEEKTVFVKGIEDEDRIIYIPETAVNVMKKYLKYYMSP
jgi:site-specific recombinase XerD